MRPFDGHSNTDPYLKRTVRLVGPLLSIVWRINPIVSFRIPTQALTSMTLMEIQSLATKAWKTGKRKGTSQSKIHAKKKKPVCPHAGKLFCHIDTPEIVTSITNLQPWICQVMALYIIKKGELQIKTGATKNSRINHLLNDTNLV